jgi:hypothetical protein
MACTSEFAFSAVFGGLADRSDASAGIPDQAHAHNMHMPSKPATKRDRRLHIILSKEEWDMLLTLGDEFGFTASDVVRQLIRREHSAISNKKKPSLLGR